MTTDDEWKLEEYRQLSEDFRNYGTQGWQIPIATIGVDALFVTAAASVLSKDNPIPLPVSLKLLIAAFILLGATVLTLLVLDRMRKWQTRTETTVASLKMFNYSGLVRFTKDEPKGLQTPLGKYMLWFMGFIDFALAVAVIELIHSMFLHS